MAEPISGESRGSTAGQRQSEGQKSSTSRNEPATTREKNLDQTIADSFPASDPPSSDPNPEGSE